MTDIDREAGRIFKFDHAVSIGRAHARHPLDLCLEIAGRSDLKKIGQHRLKLTKSDGGLALFSMCPRRLEADLQPSVAFQGHNIAGTAGPNRLVYILDQIGREFIARKFEYHAVKAVMATRSDIAENGGLGGRVVLFPFLNRCLLIAGPGP